MDNHDNLGNGHRSSPPGAESNAAQVNIPLPEGHTVVNYAVVLMTDQGACLLHAPTQAGDLDISNALDVLLHGLDAIAGKIRKQHQAKTMIEVAHLCPPARLDQ